jgi:hypothetical protein
MLDNGSNLIEEYTKLKELEKLVELNLAILDEFSELLQDNLEELEEVSYLIPKEQIVYDKLKASTKLILSHLEFLRNEMEQLWEDIELAMVELLIKQQPAYDGDSFYDHLQERYICKIDTLKEFMDMQWKLLKEDVENYQLHKKFPYEIYSRFLEKLLEFNRKI